MTDKDSFDPVDSLDIAIIGMAGRFPGAKNLDEFWRNLCNGVESISFFTEEEMEAAGVSPEEYKDPHYVNAGGTLEDVDLFDAPFFGFYPREADIIDPQQRLFLETAWQALENAAYNPDTYDGLIGVFAGTSLNTYLLFNLLNNRSIRETVHGYQLTISNDKDFLPTRVSYKLNLRGPSVNVQTACSTSLVATHLACQGLLDYQCDIALAGGVAIRLPQKSGYLYQEGGIASPDGHCRPFSVDAAGTVGGDGVGVVVLKRLADALHDGDHIYAVIKGSSINNDGSMKVGYTAPSVRGQAEVIATAQVVAGVTPDTISYIEAHGTGTALGDPIEIEALSQVFRDQTDEKGFCAIGSVKSNIGHLDAAAGVSGLIKTALALYHKELPPTINFTRPNPQIDFANSPFYVQSIYSDWPGHGAPRRAAVSSFGMGGTNAHAVLEEAPQPERTDISRPWQLLLLSARTETALAAQTANLLSHLEQHRELDLADVAFTLQVGRKTFKHRRALVVNDTDDAIGVLCSLDSQRLFESAHDFDERPVVFMFSGQGSQYANMARGLYETEPVFSEQVDLCCELLEPELGLDLRTLLFPSPDDEDEAAEQLRQTQYTQPALFTIEYALAQLWMQWGVLPESMIGHSIGEYVAACMAGVFSLEDALSLVAARGRMMQSLPGGSMLSVQLAEDELAPYLTADRRLALAGINGSALCVVSGPHDAIDSLERQLDVEGHGFRRLHTSHAFHSEMMEPIVQPFAERVASMTLNPPEIPFVSNVTGAWITNEDATDPAYWARHLRQGVRFADGLQTLFEEPMRVLLEVGPGNTLGRLAEWYPYRPAETDIATSLRHPQQHIPDSAFLLETVGKLWLAGVWIDWTGFYADERRQRLPLPTYPFERSRHWISPDDDRLYDAAVSQDSPAKRTNISEWFYIPTWKRANLAVSVALESAEHPTRLVFNTGNGLGKQLAGALSARGEEVIGVYAGDAFAQLDGTTFTINPANPADYTTLLATLQALDRTPDAILHAWSLAPTSDADTQTLGFFSLLYLAQGLQQQGITGALSIDVIGANIHDVTGEEDLSPERATLLGACKVLPQEYPHISCRLIDLNMPEVGSEQGKRLVGDLVVELSTSVQETMVAYRGRHRWVLDYEQMPLDGDPAPVSRLRSHGVYLITGGLGRIGLVLAEYLARTVQARLVLVGRSGLPPRAFWDDWVLTHGEDDAISRKIRGVQTLEASGAEVLILSADVSDMRRMREVVEQTYEHFGALHGVIHAAGLVGESAMKAVQELSPEQATQHFLPKMYGTRVLAEVLRDRELDFCLLQSSLSSVLGGLGMVAYSAANAFIDAFAAYQSRRGHTPWISINWDGWQFDSVGAAEAAFGGSLIDLAIRPEEGVVSFEKLLNLERISQIVVSTADLHARIEKWVQPESLQPESADSGVSAEALHPRPSLATEYVEPETELERSIARLWEEVIGIGPIGALDDFFELGGHSLLATQIVSRLRDVHNVPLPLRELFNAPTVRGLARLIEESKAQSEEVSTPTILPVPRADDPAATQTFPLSSGQQRLWFLDRLEQGSPLYNNFAAIRLQGIIDREALEASLIEIIKRHESLRTTFAEVDGRGVQVIHSEMPFALGYTDLRGAVSDDLAAEIQQLALEEARHPFDLSEGPLLRVQLLETADDDHVMFVTMHHIVSDGWSVAVLINEMATLYEAFRKGEKASLAPLPIQYVDYAHWQQQRLESGELDGELGYWKQQLAAVSVLELPVDHPRPAIQTSNGASVWFDLPEELHQALVRLSKVQGTTLFMTLLAALDALLYRYTMQEDIAIGTPIANRTRVETESLIGFLLNTLVMRTDLSENPTFGQLLQRVRETALGAYAHQDLPFEVLVDKLQPQRDMSRTPLFQVMFDLQQAHLAAVDIPDARLSLLRIDDGTAKFDMALSMEEAEEALGGFINYNTDLFDEATIEQMAGHFETLLAAIVADPDLRLADVPMVTPTEAEQIAAWEKTTEPLPSAPNIVEAFEFQVAQRPDAIALVFAEQEMTYKDLDGWANRVAHRLSQAGVGPEKVVGLYFERSLEMVVGLLAVLKAGGAFVFLDRTYPAGRIRYILEDAAISVVLTRPNLASDLEQYPIEIVSISPEEAGFDAAPTLSVQPEQLAYLIYTSGSTGLPKGVMVSHEAIAQHCHFIRDHFELTPRDRVLQFAALTFDQGLEQVLATLTSGATLVLRGVDIWPPEAFGRFVLEQNLTVINLPPAYWNQVVQAWADSQTPASAGDLRLVIIGGDVLLPETVALWQQTPMRSARLLNAYGPTEATITAATHDVDPSIDLESLASSVPIGRPVPPRSLHILDRFGNRMPVGVPGELYLSSALARGYLRRPDLTAVVFVPDPFALEPGARMYKTGDLVRLRRDGSLEFLGRADQQVKIRGFRIELGEIESALIQHPSVRDVAVVAREDSGGDKRLVAYLLAENEDVPGAAELHQFCKRQLPAYMVPATFMFVDAFPLTSSGKVDRRALPAPDGERPDLGGVYVAPRTPIEEELAAIWSDVIGVERVGVYDNFFELGGHSLLATQLVSRVRESYAVELPLRDLFENPVIAELAAMIEEQILARESDEDLESLLSELEGMSDEDVEKLLSDL